MQVSFFSLLNQKPTGKNKWVYMGPGPCRGRGPGDRGRHGCQGGAGKAGGPCADTAATSQALCADSVGSRNGADCVGSRNRAGSGADAVGSRNGAGSGADAVGSPVGADTAASGAV